MVTVPSFISQAGACPDHPVKSLLEFSCQGHMLGYETYSAYVSQNLARVLSLLVAATSYLPVVFPVPFRITSLPLHSRNLRVLAPPYPTCHCQFLHSGIHMWSPPPPWNWFLGFFLPPVPGKLPDPSLGVTASRKFTIMKPDEGWIPQQLC